MVPSRFRRTVLLAVVSIASVITVGSGLASPATHGDSGGAQQQTCPLPIVSADPDTVALSGPTTLWPPNGKYVSYTLTASETAGEAGDHLPHGVTISYSVNVGSAGAPSAPAQSSQANSPTGMAKGDFSVPVHFQLRAGRPGYAGSTTYVINWTATFDGGPHTCSSSASGEHAFTVTVPHDHGR